MSGENTQQSPLKISPTLLLEIAIPVLSLGGAVIALLLAQGGSPVDVRYFGIGCVAGSFILAYLAWIRPHKDIVALSTPIYSFLFFVIPSDTAVTIFLEFLYAASLTILLIRLKLRFGPAPESGRAAVIVLNRIDNRLIHGQVIEAWLPHLHIERVVVADDEAAADAPANPEPTTITSKLLLFAGLTRATEDLYFSHFCSNGPSGILLSSFDIS